MNGALSHPDLWDLKWERHDCHPPLSRGVLRQKNNSLLVGSDVMVQMWGGVVVCRNCPCPLGSPRTGRYWNPIDGDGPLISLAAAVPATARATDGARIAGHEMTVILRAPLWSPPRTNLRQHFDTTACALEPPRAQGSTSGLRQRHVLRWPWTVNRARAAIVVREVTAELRQQSEPCRIAIRRDAAVCPDTRSDIPGVGTRMLSARCHTGTCRQGCRKGPGDLRPGSIPLGSTTPRPYPTPRLWPRT